MSAKQIKNNALMDLEGGSIEALVNDANKSSSEVEKVVEAQSEQTLEAGVVVDVDEGMPVGLVAQMQQEYKEQAKKDKNKSMTFLIEPENAKFLSSLKVKGQKSDLVNKLLKMYIEAAKKASQ